MPHILIAAGITLLLCATASAQGRAEAVPEMLGEWAGFYQSVALGGPDTRPAALSVDDQGRRRFSGELGIGDPNEIPDTYSVNGTVAASGNVAFNGAGRDAEVVGNTDLHDFGMGGAILDGRLKRDFVDGSQERGALLLLRAYEGETSDDVGGAWTGMAVSDVTGERLVVAAELIIDPDQRTSFLGGISFEAAGIIVVDGIVLGTNNDTDHGTLMIGAGRDGHVIINAEYSDPPCPDMPAVISGHYRTHLTDGTEDMGTFHIEQPRRRG